VNDHSSRRIVANTLEQPTRVPCRRQVMDTYLVLLRVEFTLPWTVASHAVRSYRTLSPLPPTLKQALKQYWRRSPLCCTCRRVTPPSR